MPSCHLRHTPSELLLQLACRLVTSLDGVSVHFHVLERLKERVPYGWRRAYGLPPGLSHRSLEARGEAKRGLLSDAGLMVWRHKERQRRRKEKQRRQLVAMQPGAAGEVGQVG